MDSEDIAGRAELSDAPLLLRAHPSAAAPVAFVSWRTRQPLLAHIYDEFV